MPSYPTRTWTYDRHEDEYDAPCPVCGAGPLTPKGYGDVCPHGHIIDSEHADEMPACSEGELSPSIATACADCGYEHGPNVDACPVCAVSSDRRAPSSIDRRIA